MNTDEINSLLNVSITDLEELTLIGYSSSQMTDTIFYEFDFPKLRYLLFDTPDV